MPVLISHYGLREDSCGHGKHRGGNGVTLKVKILTPDTVMTARGMERYLFRPWGLFGGLPGTTGYTRLSKNGAAEKDIGQIDVVHLEPGDEMHFGTQGAGGYGSPLERPPERVAYDLEEELISAASARDHYGVIIENGNANLKKTQTLREQLGSNPDFQREFNFGAERLEYESLWTVDLQDAVNEALQAQPSTLRYFLRGKLRKSIETKAEQGQTVHLNEVKVMLDDITTGLEWHVFG